MSAFGWIGVDLDGTLAFYDHWRGPEHIGEPIPAMVARVKEWINDGRDVRIFTARIWAPVDDAKRQTDTAIALLTIQDWCNRHLGKVIPITCTKDFGMVELWDDRAVQVRINTGEPVSSDPRRCSVCAADIQYVQCTNHHTTEVKP